MAYFTGTITVGGAEDASELFLNLLRATIACGGQAPSASYTGTGDGTIAGLGTRSETVFETVTVTVTDDTTAGSEIWSVFGSTSGAQATATTGLLYDNAFGSFKIDAGATDFVNGDQFQFTTVSTMGADLWSIEFDNVVNLDEQEGIKQEIWFHNSGYADDDNINIGFREVRSESKDQRYLVCNSAPAITSTLSFEQQGDLFDLMQYRPALSFAPASFQYYITANKNVITGFIYTNTYSIPFYFGGFIHYGPPSARRSIISCCASQTDEEDEVDYFYTGTYRSSFWHAKADNAQQAGNVLTIDGAGIGLGFGNTNGESWPVYQADQGEKSVGLRTRIDDGTVTPLPIIVNFMPGGEKAAYQSVGEFDMWKYVSGFDISLFDVIPIEDDPINNPGVLNNYLVCQNVNETDFNDYACLKIEGV